MFSPRGHCLWLTNVHDCEESGPLHIIVLVQFPICVITAILCLVTLVLNFYSTRKSILNLTERGIHPNPIESILVFWTPSLILISLHEYFMLYNILESYLYRKLMEGIMWWLLSVGATWYLFGVIFNIPITFTYRYYKYNPRQRVPPVLMWLPSPMLSKAIVVVSLLLMLLISLPCSIMSGYYLDKGDWDSAWTFMLIDHIGGSLMQFLTWMLSVYYGYKLHKLVKYYSNPDVENAEKIRSAFYRLRNTFLFFVNFNSFSAIGWTLLVTIYVKLPEWTSTFNIVFIAYFRLALALTLLGIVINLFINVSTKLLSKRSKNEYSLNSMGSNMDHPINQQKFQSNEY